jgi:hypothetical protein
MDEDGAIALHDKSKRKVNLKNRVDEVTEKKLSSSKTV